MKLEESVFWQKALCLTESNGFSLNDVIKLEPPNILLKARRISRFAIIQGPLIISDADSAFLLPPYALQVLEPDIEEITGDAKALRYLFSSLEQKLEDFPPSIEIGTSAQCNRRCLSCVQAYQKIGKNVMRDAVWARILEELTEIYGNNDPEKVPVVHLHWYNEPLTDPKLISRLAQLQNAGVDYVVLLTNGDLLNNDKARLISNYVKMLIISAKSREVYQRFNHFNHTNEYITSVDHSIYHDEVFGFNRSGAVFAYDSDSPVRCVKGLNLQVDYDGKIYLCCNDMAKTHSEGDITLGDSLLKVWNSESVMKIRLGLIEGSFVGAPCRYCTYNYDKK